MRLKRALLCLIFAALTVFLLYMSAKQDEQSAFKNTVSVAVSSDDPLLPTGTPVETETTAPVESEDSPTIIPTTISGGMVLKNNTSYEIDVAELLKKGPILKLDASEPQVLIIHTHSSEAYSPAGLDRYKSSGNTRTQDNNYNVIRVGTELERVLKESGINVIHDCGVYDYPSYAGSYSRCEEAIRGYLEKYPSICIVFDLHRDALGTDDVIYKTVATEDGVCASQIMMVLGSDDSGLEHPNWTSNLRLALYLQNEILKKYPSLMRPVTLVPYRYNQQLTAGSMILEVGCNGNTLQEALAAIRLFGKTVGPALAELVE